MAIIEFPPVESADPHGLVGVGGDLEVSSLLLAYTSGIFPWPHEGYPLLWFAPPQRAVLFFDELHVSRRLAKYLRKADFHFAVDHDFEAVIRACQKSPRPGQSGTWITRAMIRAYIEFHRAGYAHSFEVYDSSKKLVGGLYGVWIDKLFCGESMFYRVEGASKFALIKTVEHLRGQGLSWLDAQVMTPLLESFGARDVPRQQYMQMLVELFHR
ncbi:MAG: leucyl/phenylalanyl-tRNA--protein transferase [Myxococcales bacterium]|nr:leucyl/phenylalanyl-tRNA--protein transferase [Myxococcales bacterium]